MAKRSFKKAFKVQDEWATPSLLVNMLIPYLRKWEIEFVNKNGYRPLIWLPFDTEDSQYYKIFKKEGFNVVRSHLNDDKDFFNYQPEQFDIIVSNPPYVTLEEMKDITREVSMEPPHALTDGGDGLSIIKKIIEHSKTHLKDGAPLAIEIGWKQGDAVCKIAKENGLVPHLLRDIEDRDRVVIIKRKETV